MQQITSGSVFRPNKPELIDCMIDANRSGGSFKGENSTNSLLSKLLRELKAGNVTNFTKEAQRLTSDNIDVNTPIISGWTCLHYAAYMGRTHIVKILLQT